MRTGSGDGPSARDRVIYALTINDAVFYVGRTSNKKRRLAVHQAKYGNKVRMKILQSGLTGGTVAAAESKWIRRFHEEGVALHNVRCIVELTAKSLRLSAEALRLLKIMAANNSLSQASVVELAVRELARKHKALVRE